MNIKKMLETQRQLDERIIREKNIKLSPDELLLNTYVALDVELSELANEHQWFKVWKSDHSPKPNTLEEYVDCLHFLLSIANQKGYTKLNTNEDVVREWINLWLPENLNELYTEMKFHLLRAAHLLDIESMKYNFEKAWMIFLSMGVGRMNFTLDQIEEAYFKKNEKNHVRQNEGY